MSTISQESKLVGKLSRMQMKKLHANRHKGHWLDMEPGWLLKRARYKLKLLGLAIRAKDKIALERAADVANFCAMAVDNARVKP